MEGSVSYADKPAPNPTVEFRFKPFDRPVFLSLYGTPAYEKYKADLGIAAAYGEKPDKRFRVSIIKHDYYFNEKNLSDDARYEAHPVTQRIEATYKKSQKWIAHLDLKQSTELELFMREGSSVFNYKNHSLKMSFDYFYTNDRFIGIKLGSYKTDKGFNETTGVREQTIKNNSINLYWVTPHKSNTEITTGIRLDKFTNDRIETIATLNNIDYEFTTSQMYAQYHDEYDDNMAWSYSFHIGEVKETKAFVLNTNINEEESNLESKFRVAWQCHTLDKSKIFLAHFSFNVDDLFNDPGDGGALSFQATF